WPGMILTVTADTKAPQKTYDIVAETLDRAAWMNAQWRQMPSTIELDIQRLDLNPFADIAGWRTTRMTGTITGLAPIVFTPDKGVNIQDAMFRTASTGRITFTGSSLPGFVSVKNGSAKQAVPLLKKIDYTLIE